MTAQREDNDASGASTTVRVSLVLRDFSGSPSEITRRFGISPSHSGAVGQPRVAAKGRATQHLNKHSFWAFSSPLPATTALEEQVRSILKAIESAAVALKAIGPPVVKQFNCTVIPGGAVPKLELSANTLARVASLDCDLVIDVLYIDSAET